MNKLQKAIKKDKVRFSDVDNIIKWENGEMSATEETAFFQDGVNTGQVWHMQGMYGRQAQAMLDAGVIHKPKHKTTDYYGNRVS
jgi:hypothetical protein